ncbi:MAG: hypothetical protein Q7U82_12990 [Gammaproteobacteria bacterium]|nr:hypothetical protein [Gammaproteobacteria bacterium]
MPFREKKAWATIFALLIVFIPYYVLMVQAYHRPDPNIFSLAHLAALALTSFVVLELLLVFIARRLSPEDAGIPRDEREQLFAFRAARVAYTVLIILLVLITFAMIHTEGRNWGWGMLYLMGIIIAEIVRATMLIVQYRRG